MSASTQMKRLVIVGGGYGGIRVALDLSRRQVPNLKITLISSKPHFEYYPTLYRVVTGYSALQVCVPLSEIFEGTNVEIVEDFITRVDLDEKVIAGGLGSPYEYDYLVLAPGSEASYFNIPGIAELAFGFKSTSEALKLKQHLHDVLTPSTDPDVLPEQKVMAAHFVIVGGGPTGVELSGELMEYGKHLAKNHGSDPGMITVDLIESSPRLLAAMPPDFSAMVYQRLHEQHVNIFLNRTVIKEEVGELMMKDMQLKTQTVIWTAGVRTNRLIAQIADLELDKRGRVVVDQYLQAKGHKHVFVLGDSASTKYSGLAQTADDDGKYLARYLQADLVNAHRPVYVPHQPIYAIPAGPHWAGVLWGNTRIYGLLGSWLRSLADLRYFLTILPINKALRVFSKHGVLSESCPVCAAELREIG